MDRATAISMPMAPVMAAVLHMLLTSGSMGALPLTWPRRPGQGGSRPPSRSGPPPHPLSGLELRRDREERHLVVRLAQAPRQGAYEVPQQVVGQVAVDEQQVGQVVLGDDEQLAALVGVSVGAPGEVVDEGHLAEVVVGLQD